MDIARPELKRQKRRRRIIWGTVGLVCLGAVTVGVSRLKPAAPEVERSAVWTDSVNRVTTPLANQRICGAPLLQLNTGQANFGFAQAFATGSTISLEFNNNRQTTNSPFFTLSPALGSMYRFSFQQQLLSGFGFGPNLGYLKIARNNKKISDIAFKDRVMATVTQIENIYWD